MLWIPLLSQMLLLFGLGSILQTSGLLIEHFHTQQIVWLVITGLTTLMMATTLIRVGNTLYSVPGGDT